MSPFHGLVGAVASMPLRRSLRLDGDEDEGVKLPYFFLLFRMSF